MKDVSQLAYVGHATMLIEMDGVRILTDPLLRHRVGPLRRQVATPEGSFRQIDAVLISHLHGDHLDLPSLRLIGGDPRLIVPRGAATFLRKQGAHRVEEIQVGERRRIGSVSVEATLANHSGHRPPFGPTTHCIGFMIHGSHRVYFAGDTDRFPEMRIHNHNLDIALLPVWGWGPTLGTGHMDPFRAARSLARLCPRVAIPIHWGTYCPVAMGWTQPGFLSRPPREFASHAAAHAPTVDVRILEPGQSFYPEGRIDTGADDG